MSTISTILSFMNWHCENKPPEQKVEILISNISTIYDLDNRSDSGHAIICSLAYIEEESTLKNRNVYQTVISNNEPGIAKLSNPTKYLNIGVLFSAHQKDSTENNYLQSLMSLVRVIQIFQDRNVFRESEMTTPESKAKYPTGVEKFSLEVQILKMEELNQMWGSYQNKIVIVQPKANWIRNLISQ